ncbi:MAG: hypothetical protein ACQGVC_17385 [Myxococcota bacterium]
MTPEMADADPRSQAGYTARVAMRAVVDAAGVRFAGEEGQPQQLDWSEVVWAIAAEVGEPEGVRTIVFDLVVGRADGAWQVLRLDAEPGEDASRLARVVETGLGGGRKVPSVRSLAKDAIPARWYPDLASFEEDARRELATALAP